MKHFTSVSDVENLQELLADALEIKKDPFLYQDLGKNKTLGLIFLNPSLRTRISTQKAAMNLGMQTIVMNIDREGWALEFQDQIVMNSDKVEHVKDAAGVIGRYCDILGIRCFPSLISRESDYSEQVLGQFIKYSGIPVISLESATLHPLQSLADLMTIEEHRKPDRKPKVVLTWAPHIKALPQAVPNSFSEWMCRADVDFVITHPEGYELDERYTEGASIIHSQDEALEGADFIYVKNWSSYREYGKVLSTDPSWMLDPLKVKEAKVMHCLPVRRNLELSDEVLDSSASLTIEQAENRVYAAQTALKKLLEYKMKENEEIIYPETGREHY